MNKSVLPAIIALVVGIVGGYFLGSRKEAVGGGGPIAAVFGDAITQSDLMNHMRAKQSVTAVLQNQAVPNVRTAGTIGFLAIEDLINQRLVMQLAKDAGVWPDDAAVLKELELKKESNPQFVEQLKQTGQSLDQIKYGLRLDLAMENLVTKGVSVTIADVDKYLKDNPSSMIDPAKVNMLFVFIKEDAAKADVDRALAQGESFAAVAARFNVDPTAREARGQFGERTIADLRKQAPEIAAVVEKTDELRTTEWVKTGDGWAKFYIERKTQDKKINPDANMKENMRRRLAISRGQLSNDVAKKLQERLKEGIRNKQIKIDDESLRKEWERAADRLLANEKTSAPAGDQANAPATPPANGQ